MTAVASLLLFVGGNGLLTVAEKTVNSGMASVLGATTPLWMALAETAWPRGERLACRGWIGLLLGLGGVLVLLAPKLSHPMDCLTDSGPWLVLGGSASWSIGSVMLRYGRRGGTHLTGAAYQLFLGGMGLVLVGLACGEAHEVTSASLTPKAIFAFWYLLVVGSLVGFLAYTWLLRHVSVALVGTYAYVNPVVAVLVGWLLAGEEISAGILGGMGVILLGVALVRQGHGRHSPAKRWVDAPNRGTVGKDRTYTPPTRNLPPLSSPSGRGEDGLEITHHTGPGSKQFVEWRRPG